MCWLDYKIYILFIYTIFGLYKYSGLSLLIAFINGNYFITEHSFQIFNCIQRLISIFIVKSFIIVNIKLYEIKRLTLLMHLLQAHFLLLITNSIKQFTLCYALKRSHSEIRIEANHVFHYVY